MHRKESEGTPMSQDERRDFLKKAKTASLGVPATALLLSVTRKPARASDGDSDAFGDGDT